MDIIGINFLLITANILRETERVLFLEIQVFYFLYENRQDVRKYYNMCL